MSRPVKCYYCGEIFDKDNESYTIPVSRRYAHLNCDNWANKIHNEARKNLLQFYVKTKVDKDILKLINENGWSLEDIYGMCLYWFYEQPERPNPSKSQGGIGILPYIAPQYFEKKRKQEQDKKINLGKHIKDYVDLKGNNVTFVLPPIRKPRGKNFFDLE